MISDKELNPLIDAVLNRVYKNTDIENELLKNYHGLLKDSGNPTSDDAKIGAMMFACFDKAVEVSIKSVFEVLRETGAR